MIGRAALSNSNEIKLKLLVDGELDFRPSAPGGIPIGSYAEFQLINTGPYVIGASFL